MPRENLPPELLARLDPVEVKGYAKATGWVREARLGAGRVAVFAHPVSDLDQILVPLHRDARGFGPAMGDVVNILAEKENRPAAQVLGDLLMPPADALRFSESGHATEAGDVPLDHGLDMMAGARKQLLAAACSVVRPESYFPRMSLGEAEQFLRQCRMRPSELGSFTVAVACPLHALPDDAPLLDEVPFTRRVTALLMRSLSRLALAIESDEIAPLLEPAEGETVISANLCEGLLQMTPEEGEGAALTVTASWARTLPPSRTLQIPASVRLRRESFRAIEALANRLRPAHAPRRQTLVGFVDTLNGRPNDENEREGEVILRLADPESDNVRARVVLGVADYRTACDAHNPSRPVLLEGVLHRGGRISRIADVNNFRLLAPPAAASPESP